jgi:lipooligosaccharide transport system ATP-binding protein
VVEIRFEDARPPLTAFDGLGERFEELPDRVLVYTTDGDATAAALAERDLPPHSTLIRRGTLEDVFLHLTGRTLVD